MSTGEDALFRAAVVAWLRRLADMRRADSSLARSREHQDAADAAERALSGAADDLESKEFPWPT